MKIILDTNVFISGIFWSGPPHQILKAWQANEIKLVVSKEILEEYNRVSEELSRKYPIIDLSSIMELLAIKTELHMAEKLYKPISSDPDDDKFFACALSARVKAIVSGDRDLLEVSGHKGIEVIKPSAFIKQYLEK